MGAGVLPKTTLQTWPSAPGPDRLSPGPLLRDRLPAPMCCVRVEGRGRGQGCGDPDSWTCALQAALRPLGPSQPEDFCLSDKVSSLLLKSNSLDPASHVVGPFPFSPSNILPRWLLACTVSHEGPSMTLAREPPQTRSLPPLASFLSAAFTEIQLADLTVRPGVQLGGLRCVHRRVHHRQPVENVCIPPPPRPGVGLTFCCVDRPHVVYPFVS